MNGVENIFRNGKNLDIFPKGKLSDNQKKLQLIHLKTVFSVLL